MRNRRHRPLAKTLTYHSAARLPEEWDQLLPEGHFLKSASLLAHEKTGLPDVENLYKIMVSQGHAIGVAAFQVLRIAKKHVKPGALSGIRKWAWRFFAALARPRILIAGHLFRHDVETVYFSPHLPAFTCFRLYQDAILAALPRCGAAAVLVKDMPARLAPHFRNQAPDFLPLRNDISMVLHLPSAWDTLNHYQASLKHKYAQRFRKVRQGMAGLEVKELNLLQTQQEAATLYQLYTQVSENQSVRLGVLSQSFLPEMKRFYPDLKIWAIYEAGTMVAFFSAFTSGSTLDMFYIGFSYEKNAEKNLYFNLLFLGVEMGINLRKSRVVFGRTALEAKARLGCRPFYLHTFLLIKNPLLRRLAGRAQSSLQQNEGDWEQRHPFKNEPETPPVAAS